MDKGLFQKNNHLHCTKVNFDLVFPQILTEVLGLPSCEVNSVLRSLLRFDLLTRVPTADRLPSRFVETECLSILHSYLDNEISQVFLYF